MNYIQRSSSGIIVCGNTTKIINIGLIAYLNLLSQNYLRDVKTSQRIIQKRFGINTNIPIPINRDICFVLSKGIRDYMSILININEIFLIEEIDSCNCKIIFLNQVEKSINCSKKSLQKRVKQAREISIVLHL